MPTMPDIAMIYERNEDNFFVAEDDRGNILGFATGYEKKGIPQEVLMSWKAKRVGYLDLMAVGIQKREACNGDGPLKLVPEQFKIQGVITPHLGAPAPQEVVVKVLQKHGFTTQSYTN